MKSGSGSGIGVRNVNERIRLYFGQEYGLSIESELDEGTVVTIHMRAVPYAETAEGKRSMSNREKSAGVPASFSLVMLYLLSSTDLIIKEKEGDLPDLRHHRQRE